MMSRQLSARRPEGARRRDARPHDHDRRTNSDNGESGGDRPSPATAPPSFQLLVELKRVGRRPAAAKLAIGAIDLGGAACVAAFAIRVVLLDEALVRLLDGGGIGAGSKAKNGKGGNSASHGQRV